MNPVTVSQPIEACSAASESAKRKARTMKRWRLITLGAIVYLSPIPLWLLSKMLPQSPILLLLITQSWLSMSATAVFVLADFY
jgi:hypothetical protein